MTATLPSSSDEILSKLYRSTKPADSSESPWLIRAQALPPLFLSNGRPPQLQIPHRICNKDRLTPPLLSVFPSNYRTFDFLQTLYCCKLQPPSSFRSKRLPAPVNSMAADFADLLNFRSGKPTSSTSERQTSPSSRLSRPPRPTRPGSARSGHGREQRTNAAYAAIGLHAWILASISGQSTELRRMASKLQIERLADQVDIDDLWRALTKDKVEVLRKASPDLVTEVRILEGDGIGLGSLLSVSYGTAMPGVVESLKERIVEFDEGKRLVSYLGIGGYMNLGFSRYVMSVKLDDAGDGKTLITTTLNYDLEQNFDGAHLLEECPKILGYYLDSVISYLQTK